ncbi:unnamed protein product [Clonostachys chloroleuca]|uniref:Uncharacterized protein n=1 Tax=Clonostachys chloroleuca TaxID=1926264 RepID=A0AA35MIF1_9HYPO|nr:unnamed protein product [Clonostachys chloroleuca]
MATQSSGVWDGHNYPQPAMMGSAFFSQTIMPMVQPSGFLPNHPQSSQEESSEWSVGFQESVSSVPSTPPDLSPPSFNLKDNLDPWDSNVIGYQDVILPERDVGWGRLFCGSGEQLGANVTSPSEGINPCPAAAAALAAGSDSRQAFRCSCCGKHQLEMRFSRDGSIPSEQTRHKTFAEMLPLYRGRSTAGGAPPQAAQVGFQGEHVFFLACVSNASQSAWPRILFRLQQDPSGRPVRGPASGGSLVANLPSVSYAEEYGR